MATLKQIYAQLGYNDKANPTKDDVINVLVEAIDAFLALKPDPKLGLKGKDYGRMKWWVDLMRGNYKPSVTEYFVTPEAISTIFNSYEKAMIEMTEAASEAQLKLFFGNTSESSDITLESARESLSIVVDAFLASMGDKSADNADLQKLKTYSMKKSNVDFSTKGKLQQVYNAYLAATNVAAAADKALDDAFKNALKPMPTPEELKRKEQAREEAIGKAADDILKDYDLAAAAAEFAAKFIDGRVGFDIEDDVDLYPAASEEVATTSRPFYRHPAFVGFSTVAAVAVLAIAAFGVAYAAGYVSSFSFFTQLSFNVIVTACSVAVAAGLVASGLTAIANNAKAEQQVAPITPVVDFACPKDVNLVVNSNIEHVEKTKMFGYGSSMKSNTSKVEDNFGTELKTMDEIAAEKKQKQKLTVE